MACDAYVRLGEAQEIENMLAKSPDWRGDTVKSSPKSTTTQVTASV